MSVFVCIEVILLKGYVKIYFPEDRTNRRNPVVLLKA